MPAPTPFKFDPKMFTQAGNTFQLAAQNVLPSTASLDKAAGRLRSRVEGRQQAGEQRARDLHTGRNFGNLNTNLNQIRQEGDSAFASGLADLELGFEDKRQAGADILSRIGSGQVGLGTASGGLQRDAAQQAIDRFFSQGDLDLGRDRLELDETLGLGEQGIKRDEQRSLEEFRQVQNMLGFLQNLGTFGNTEFPEGSPQAAAFQNFLQQINEAFGNPDLPAPISNPGGPSDGGGAGGGGSGGSGGGFSAGHPFGFFGSPIVAF